MEDNEHNQMLAQQVLNMASQGCMIGVSDPGVLCTVGYAEMWLDRDIFFFCEMNGGTTGYQHVIHFASFDARANQVLFYDPDGNLLAGLAPFIEWPEIDAQQMAAQYHAWQKSKLAMESSKKAADEWRHAPFSFDSEEA